MRLAGKVAPGVFSISLSYMFFDLQHLITSSSTLFVHSSPFY
jgi:hypothetical protein